MAPLIYIYIYIYIYIHVVRVTPFLVIFGGKIRSCEKSAGPVNCSVHRNLYPVTLVDLL